jgi:hypothetical protein
MRCAKFLSIMTLTASCALQGANYQSTSVYDAVPATPNRLQLKVTQEGTKGYGLRKIFSAFENGVSSLSKWSYTFDLQKQATETSQWMEAGISLRYKLVSSQIALRTGRKFYRKNEKFFPYTSGDLTYVYLNPWISFSEVKLFAHDPIVWSQDFIDRGIHRDGIEIYGELQPASPQLETVLSATSSRVFQNHTRFIGGKQTLSVRSGMGPEFLNLKMGLFTDQERWSAAESEFTGVFSESVSVFGPYLGIKLGFFSSQLTAHALTRIGWGDSSSKILRLQASEASIDVKLFKDAVIRLGLSEFRSVGIRREVSGSYSAYSAIRMIL